MSIPGRTRAALAAVLLCACPQGIWGPGDERDGSGDGPGDTETPDGGGTNPGTDGGGTKPDGGSPASDGGGQGGSISIECTRVGTGPVTAGVSIEVDCTSTPAAGTLTWSAKAEPAVGYFSNQLAASGKLWVTFRPADLPKDFADTDVVVTITAAKSGSAPRDAALTIPVIGNLLVGDNTNGGIAAFRSDGTTRSEFVGPARVARTTLVYRLRDGSILAGAVTGRGTPTLQTFDAHGTLLHAFDDADHAGAVLFENDSYPWGAAQEPDGTIWVSKKANTDYRDSAVYRFTSAGTYQDTLVPPSDLTTLQAHWVPMGMALLSDGTMAIGNGSGSFTRPYVALYPPSGSPHHVRLGFLVCDTGPDGNPVCRDNLQSGGRVMNLMAWNGEIIAALDYSSGATLAAYSDPDLGFLRSTQHKDGSSEYGFWNHIFGWMTHVGSILVVSKPNYGCPIAVDPQTLYIPATWRDQTSGCFVPAGSSVMRGLAHLGP